MQHVNLNTVDTIQTKKGRHVSQTNQLMKKLQQGHRVEPEEKGDESHQYANKGACQSFV